MRLSPVCTAVAGAVLIGCSGGGGTEPPATTPPTVPPPGSIPPTVLSGLVYVRSDNVAWPADVAGTPGASNVSVTLNSATATTTGNGAWSLQTIIQATPDALPVTATVSGYLPSW